MLDKNFPRAIPYKTPVSAEQINWLTDRMNGLLRSLAQFGMIDSTGFHIRKPIDRPSGNTGLFKITAGPASTTHYYTARKQKWNGTAFADESTVDYYISFVNNDGDLPSGSSGDVNGRFYTAMDVGRTVTVGEVVTPVWISTEHLGYSDFASPPA